MKNGKSEHLIQKVVGCGPFQASLLLSVCLLSKAATSFSFIFMAFGNLNPGWKCLDQENNTATQNPDRGHDSNNTPGEYIKDNCPLFQSCDVIQFHPESSTIITEWNLLCDNAWIASVLISVQMSGVLVGSLTSGPLADAFGRKKILYLSQACTTCLNAGAAFTTTWQVFAVVRFFLGVSIAFHGTLFYVYTVEFLTKKWRSVQAVMPWYAVCALAFGVICLLLKDWRQLHIATALVGGVGFLPYFWVPESLRWCEVKNKTAQFETTAKRMARFNNRTSEVMKYLESMNSQDDGVGVLKSEVIDIADEKNRKRNCGLFRDGLRLCGKGYRKYTILVALDFFFIGLIYYAIGFGVKALNGNFYVNLIMFYAAEVVFNCMLMFVPNALGRKKAGVLFASTSGLCLLTAACVHNFASPEEGRVIGVAVLVMAGNIMTNALWSVMLVFISEIYPTVVRGVATSQGLTFSRLGGILAPVLIPAESSRFVACYVIMGALGLVCALSLLVFPETKGKVLANTFQESNQDGDVHVVKLVEGRGGESSEL